MRGLRWTLCSVLLLVLMLSAPRLATTQPAAMPQASVPRGSVRLDSGRFTVVAGERDRRLAASVLEHALARDTFPGLPRPVAHVLIAIAPSAEAFRAWVGRDAPEWGAAIAMPSEQRLVMQGSYGNSQAGDPVVVLRHELAHLALHEAMGDLPPRWFDEGYASVAAGEWTRGTALETSVALAWRSLPGGDGLDDGFFGGASRAEYTYALAHLAVAEMQAIDQRRGLANFFAAWKRTGSYDAALREAYGLTATSFDNYWHQRVRRQYGVLALVANLSLAFGFIAVLMGPMYWTRKRRDRKRLHAMRIAEAAQEEAARQSVLAMLLALEAGVPESNTPSSVVGSGSPHPASATTAPASLDSGSGQA